MSDGYRLFVTILSSLKSLYQSEPKGNFYRHLRSTAFLINGIILSKSCHLPNVSDKCVDMRKPASREKKFYRLIKNKRFTYHAYYMPFAKALIQSVQTEILAVSFDGSTIGHGCIVLVAGLVYKNRSLPLCWIVKKGAKGHFSEETHNQLLEQLMQIIPKKKTVVILGDGEFDNAGFLLNIKKNNWFFVARTAQNRIVVEDKVSFQMRDLDVGNYDCFWVLDISPEKRPDFTCHAVVWWNRDFKEPIYLFTNLLPIYEALFWYKKRFSIETFFSDQKSRGFNIHKSHISEPERLAKLLIAAALAYIFIVYLGILTIKNNMLQIIHRNKRCDWSLFKIGFHFLNYQLSQFAEIPKMEQLDFFCLLE